jgi:hypothetical protein
MKSGEWSSIRPEEVGHRSRRTDMRKYLASILALGIVAALAPMSAQADHCNRNVIVFSYVNPVLTYDPRAAVCRVDSGEDVNGSIIYPGSTQISIRYTQPVDGDPAFVWAQLTGSLFPNGLRVKLRPQAGTLGGTFYDSDNIAISRTSSGCLYVDVELPDEEEDDRTDEATYGHVGQTC